MGHLHMKRQGLKSTKEKPPDKDLEEKSKKNEVFCTAMDPSTKKERKYYSDLCRFSPTTLGRGNRYIHLMYVYDCNAILTTAMKNGSDKEIIQAFK